MTTRRTPSDEYQQSLFDEPAEPPQSHGKAQEPQRAPQRIDTAPPTTVATVASDAERDRQSYAALVGYI